MMSTPMVIPSDFPGLHTGNYLFTYGGIGTPDTTTNPAAPSKSFAAVAPSFDFGSMRSHDCIFGFWRRNNPSQGVYDWVYLDAAVADAKANSRSMWYTLYGTPQWAASTVNGMNTWADAYSFLGGNAPAAQLSYVTDFISALVTRYNTGANAGANRGIKVIEAWNEPDFSNPTTYVPGTTNTLFWWGSLQQLLAINKAIYDTAKAIDPGIQISAPGFTSANRAAVYFLNAESGSGKFAYEFNDIFAFHPYKLYPTPHESMKNLIDSTGDISNSYGQNACGVVMDMLRAKAPNLSYVYSEYGFDDAQLTTNTLPSALFLAMSSEYRKARIIRTGLISLLQGVSNIYFYAYTNLMSGAMLNNVADSRTPVNRYPADTAGVIAGMQYLRSISGKTIVSGGYWSDGSVQANFSDGTSIRI
jgi:hypothetical protein